LREYAIIQYVFGLIEFLFMREGKMRGRVLSVNISSQKGEKKHDIGSCRLIRDLGLEDDAHAGMKNRQVSLLAEESIKKIRDKGINLQYGDFAENITTEGIILHLLPLGTEMRIGEKVLLRVTQIGKECHDRCAIFAQVGDCVMPREGIFAEVLIEGEIKVGDEIITSGSES
jgi:MOSC domain-containing protein YiiM